MGASAADNDLPDGRAADGARLAGAAVDPVLDLEVAAHAFGVDVIGHGTTAQLDGAAEDFDQSFAEAGELFAGDAGGLSARADSGAEEGLVGVDVADAVEQGLIEQRGLDGGLAAAEEGDEVFERDGERFAAGAGVGGGCRSLRRSFPLMR